MTNLSRWNYDGLKIEEKHSFPTRPWRVAKKGYHWQAHRAYVRHMQARLRTASGWVGNIAACDFRIVIHSDLETEPEAEPYAKAKLCGHCLRLLRHAGLID